eukprot:819454-Pelagomonas_calceolata.AAC.4
MPLPLLLLCDACPCCRHMLFSYCCCWEHSPAFRGQSPCQLPQVMPQQTCSQAYDPAKLVHAYPERRAPFLAAPRCLSLTLCASQTLLHARPVHTPSAGRRAVCACKLQHTAH